MPFPRIIPSQAALIMIDFQRDFCDPGGYADQAFGESSSSSSSEQEWVESIIPTAAKLLQGARQMNDKNNNTGGVRLILHTREGYAADLSDVGPVKQRRSQAAGAPIGQPGPLGRFLIRGEAGHFHIDRLAPQEGEVILDKCTYGTFASTDIHERLQRAGVTQLILAGVTADVCVHTTLREAVDRGYECFYCKDAISTPDETIRKACELMVEHEGGIWGWLVTVDEVLQSLNENGARDDTTTDSDC
eukprot:scaffold29231_cov268-Amphora_coffeaeformis.AAC.1